MCTVRFECSAIGAFVVGLLCTVTLENNSAGIEAINVIDYTLLHVISEGGSNKWDLYALFFCLQRSWTCCQDGANKLYPGIPHAPRRRRFLNPAWLEEPASSGIATTATTTRSIGQDTRCAYTSCVVNTKCQPKSVRISSVRVNGHSEQ